MSAQDTPWRPGYFSELLASLRQERPLREHQVRIGQISLVSREPIGLREVEARVLLPAGVPRVCAASKGCFSQIQLSGGRCISGGGASQ